MKQIKIGNVCKCRLNRLGVVTSKHKAEKGDGLEYYGIGFDGKPWQSVEPEVVAENINHYIAKKLDEQEKWANFKPGEMK